LRRLWQQAGAVILLFSPPSPKRLHDCQPNAGESFAMSIFCTKCGTANEGGAAFCDNCGTPLRAALAKKVESTSVADGVTASIDTRSMLAISPDLTKKFIYAAVGLVGVLVLGSGVGYVMLKAPVALASTLLAAVKSGYGEEINVRFKRELCLSNIDYSKNTFNAGENDRRTQAWLNALVAGGLYSPPVAISSGGFFPQTLLQYVATPELVKYRQGNRLCAAQDVDIVDVIDIEKPEEEALGKNGGPPRITVVKAKLVVQSVNTAPWLNEPEVRNAFMAKLNGWEYIDTSLQKRVDDTFGLKDNKWTTGVAYKESLELLYKNAQRGSDGSTSQGSKSANSGNGGSWVSKLSGLFTMGHPLKGTWRTAAQDIGFGVVIPAGTGPTLTFTADTMESVGQEIKVDFEVDGERVKVTPKGESQSLIFSLQGPDAMVSEAMAGLRYERVK
jgi:hypothetical protein